MGKYRSLIVMKRSVLLNNGIKILPEGCAIIKGSLVIADLHLGYEGVLATSGLFMPRVGLREIIEKMEQVIEKESEVEQLIVNGDLKHEFSELHKFEWKEVDSFIKYAKERFRSLVIVRGNHDNYLKLILKKYGLRLCEHYLLDDYLFIHGDRLIMNMFGSENIIIGHEHPAMVIKDSIDVKVKVPCFLYGRIEEKNVLVLPSFSPIFPGSDVISMPNSGLLSPMLKKWGIEEMKVYACVENEILEFPSVKVIRSHI